MSRFSIIIDGRGKHILNSDGSKSPYRWHHALVDKFDARFAKHNRHWRKRQKEFARTETRYYGDGGTIHRTGEVNVELWKGRVVAVWFRCQPLPFTASECDQQRANDMLAMYAQNPPGSLRGVEIKDGAGK